MSWKPLILSKNNNNLQVDGYYVYYISNLKHIQSHFIEGFYLCFFFLFLGVSTEKFIIKNLPIKISYKFWIATHYLEMDTQIYRISSLNSPEIDLYLKKVTKDLLVALKPWLFFLKKLYF